MSLEDSICIEKSMFLNDTTETQVITFISV